MTAGVRDARANAKSWQSQDARWRLYLALVEVRTVMESGGALRLHDAILRALTRVERVVAQRDAGFSVGRPVAGGSGMLADALRDLADLVDDVYRTEAA